MKLLRKILSNRGLTATLFEEVFNQAVKLYARENVGIEQSERIKFVRCDFLSQRCLCVRFGVICECISSGTCAVGNASDHSRLLPPDIT